jgi:hypothetical protein
MIQGRARRGDSHAFAPQILMGRRNGILLFIVSAATVLIAGWLLLAQRPPTDLSGVSVFTDKLEYRVDETIWITIQNQGDHLVDVYCPIFCELGNFPTTVEGLIEGRWEYVTGFCPSIEPLSGNGDYEDGYYRHPLAAGGSFELEISGFTAVGLQPDKPLRIVYYLGAERTPVYSNEFTVGK